MTTKIAKPGCRLKQASFRRPWCVMAGLVCALAGLPRAWCAENGSNPMSPRPSSTRSSAQEGVTRPGGLAPAASPPGPPPLTPTAPTPAPENPASASAALERIRAAYEYGDIDEVVEWSRQVTEGRLHPTPQERAYALRYLGIGLFLTGRAEGAETAFFELLRLRSDTRLDPKTTRPDAVAFFEQVRHRHAQEIQTAARTNNPKMFLWNFLPPIAQFQNGHRARGITIGALELVSLGTAVVTYSLLTHWSRPDDTFPDHESDARALKVVNYISVGVLVATYVFGVIDGIAHYADSPDDDTANPSPTTVSVSLAPSGLTLKF